MNYMNEVAKMLGVELNEEFNISSFGSRKYKLTQYGLNRFYEPSGKWVASYFLCNILNGSHEIVKIPKPILDEKEKEYLSAVIKPFRYRIKCIYKRDYYNFYEYITIAYYDKLTEEVFEMYFPVFKKGTMYKGMETNKEYALEELGL